MKQTQNTKRLANSESGPVSTVVEEPSLTPLRELILGYWPSRRNDFFPGPQPVSLERRDLFKLKKFKYLACVKSDGMRFMMLCTTVDGKSKNFMVDRAFRFYEIDQIFDDVLYSNSLFDGELVKVRVDKKVKWTYIIHDCIAFKNDDISKKNFPDRYRCVQMSVDTLLKPVDTESSFPVRTKKFVEFSDLESLVKCMNDEEINHATDGIIFTPRDLPIGSNTQYTLFKWKERKLHTFDFKLVDEECRGEPSYIAYVNKKSDLTPFAAVTKSSELGKDFEERLSKIKDYKSGCILECDYNEDTRCFEPLFVRNDKTHPNGIYTVDKTLLNIRENITVEELVHLSKYNYVDNPGLHPPSSSAPKVTV